MTTIRMFLTKSFNVTNNLKLTRSNAFYQNYSTTTKFQSAAEVAPIAKPQNADEEVDKPIAYTRSKANQWQAKSSREGTDMERLWYEPYVILGSLTVFMIYFCVLREESDIDKEFEKTLYNRIKGMEEKQLIISLNYNLEHGLDTKAIEDRLREIDESKR